MCVHVQARGEKCAQDRESYLAVEGLYAGGKVAVRGILHQVLSDLKEKNQVRSGEGEPVDQLGGESQDIPGRRP